MGQNLFALFPLVQPESTPAFAIHQQLLDLEAACRAVDVERNRRASYGRDLRRRAFQLRRRAFGAMA